ncbi:MAG: tetratricopeptide repeat protein [Opitutaceae bacterium]
MNSTRCKALLSGLLILALAGGCGSSNREPTEKERKEAALYASEGQFALSVKEWPRAEELFLKASQASPAGDYFLSLGVARLRLGKRSEAKAAYEHAVRAFAREAAREPALVEPWLRQAYALAVLGRMDESRALLGKATKKFPNDGRLRTLNEAKGFEQMVAAPNFKEMAL